MGWRQAHHSPAGFVLAGLLSLLLVLAGCSQAADETVLSAVAPAATLPPPPITEATLPPSTALPQTAVSLPTATPLPTTTPSPTATPPPTATLPPPVLINPALPLFVDEAAAYDVGVTVLDGGNTGVWQYAANSFIHPIALDVLGETAYLLDGGRVLALNLTVPQPPQVLLRPGDLVDGVMVLEPVDLAVADGGLVVLDRAGDVYRYAPDAGVWAIDRADRGVGESSGHYFVAIAPGGENGRYLLETNYKYTLRYTAGASRQDALWLLPDVRAVDVAVSGEQVYVLGAEPVTLAGRLAKYEATSLIDAFRANVPMAQPRQIVAGETAVYVLDNAGRRLLQFEPGAGRLQAVYQLPQDVPAAAVWTDASGTRLLFAGRDRLYFWQQPQRLAHVAGGGEILALPQPHDTDWLLSLPDLVVPIPGSPMTVRDFQLPGAPRHYRLGVHEGLDFYWQRGTVVTAVADGTVIRANVDFSQPSYAEIAAWQTAVQASGHTPEDALDFYRGRQVWIAHAGGIVSRYVHLDTIAPEIREGTAVVQGQPIGTVGNSGSPSAIESSDADVHLHFELWLGEQAYVGQFLRPIETREWLQWLLWGEGPLIAFQPVSQ